MALKLGVLTLDSPASLNALSLPDDPDPAGGAHRLGAGSSIVCVLLQGTGRRRSAPVATSAPFITASRRRAGRNCWLCPRLFEQEYRLDHHIHRYTKPLICVADGICMGRYRPLAGAAFRIVTERSLFAMPEVTIGLYPDVGPAGS